jgi:hypothetical protein
VQALSLLVCLGAALACGPGTGPAGTEGTLVLPHVRPLSQGNAAFTGAEREVAVSRVLGGENTFGRPVAVRAIDGLVFLIDGSSLRGDNVLLALDSATGEVVHVGGPKGQGPGELVHVSSIDVDPRFAQAISVYDSDAYRVTSYSYETESLEPLSYTVHDDAARTGTGCWLGENRYVINGYFDDHVLRYYDVSDDGRVLELDRTAGVGVIEDEPPAALRFLNMNHLAVRPDGTRVAVAYIAANRLQIYDDEGSLLVETGGPQEVQPTYLDRTPFPITINGPAGYVQVAASDKHVYALFSGRDDEWRGYSDTVHVFSWDGELVETLKLEKRIVSMSVTADGGQLVGIWDQEEGLYSQVLVFDLDDGSVSGSDRAQ